MSVSKNSQLFDAVQHCIGHVALNAGCQYIAIGNDTDSHGAAVSYVLFASYTLDHVLTILRQL